MNIKINLHRNPYRQYRIEKTAYDYGNQEIEQEHLLYTLLTQDDSLI